MSKKDMESKLGNTVRQAKGEPLAAQNAVRLPASKPLQRPARQENQASPVSLNDPLGSLHPERIWPD